MPANFCTHRPTSTSSCVLYRFFRQVEIWGATVKWVDYEWTSLFHVIDVYPFSMSGDSLWSQVRPCRNFHHIRVITIQTLRCFLCLLDLWKTSCQYFSHLSMMIITNKLSFRGVDTPQKLFKLVRLDEHIIIGSQKPLEVVNVVLVHVVLQK